MKNIPSFLLLLLSLCSLTVFAQPYGNEWINYNQQYYTMKIASAGVYRISFQTLQNAGINPSSIAPQDFQIFGKEKEQPIRVEDGGDGVFGPGDFIEFYAQRNDGWLDSILYDDPNTISNPAYSLYNDTLVYFLTWRSGNNKRFVQETDVNFNIYTPADYFWQRSAINYNSNYYGGNNVLNAYSSFFEAGEGWGGSNNNGANGFTLNISVPTPNAFNGVGAPSVAFHGKSMANSNANFTGQGNHHLRWEVGSSNQMLYSEIFIGIRQTIVNETFSPNLLSSPNTNVAFRIIGDQGAATDFQSVHYLHLDYPRQPNIGNLTYNEFWVENNPLQAKVRLDLTASNLNNPTCYVFEGSVPRKIPMVNNGGVWQLLIPNSTVGNRQKVVIANQNQIQNINALTPVNSNGQFTNFNNIDFEAAFIMVTHKSLQSASNQYRNYRSSAAGGGHNAVLLDIDELYLQFGGGVMKHVFGIRRMANFAYNATIEKPVGLLLLGKGIREANEPNTFTGTGTRKSASSYANSLVPSYGYPSSDNTITARFNNSNSWAPFIPTGRIAARNNADLAAYLEKLQVYENAQNQNDVYNKPNKEWQKQILHFGGGANAGEQQTFRTYLNNMKHTIEHEYFGGNVTSYFKDNSNPFNPVLTSEVTAKLQEGISLMTFFGHASATGFDQNVDDPENWGNTGKYPILIGNSCYTGDIFQPVGESASERFVLIPNLGTVGFLSSTKLGFASFLYNFSSELYRQISPKNYGLPLALQLKKTIEAIEGNSTNFILETTVQQMALHGDPLMKLNWHSLPEIDLTIQDVFFEPTSFDLTTDSIEMNVVLTNLGKSILDTFSLDIRRVFPSSDIDSLYKFEINGLHYRDTFTFKMPLQPQIGIGLNSFNIQADIPSFVDEIYDEYGNNEITVDLFINIDGIIPVLPYNYAVVPNDSVVLKASTINPIASFNTYRFEIDTTDLFNSPQHRYAMVSGLGGVKEVFPNDWRFVSNNASAPLILQDSMAYFWRVAVDSTTPFWIEHSFQYIKGKEGWGQDHFYQFKNGGFNGIDYDRPTRKRKFEPAFRELSAQVHDNASNATTLSQTLWMMNSEIVEYAVCTTTPSIHVGVVDPVTFEPWGTFNGGQNVNNQFGNANNGSACRNRVEFYFIFRQNSAGQLQNLENMLDAIPNGHHIVIYTSRFAEYNNWQNLHPSLFQTFQNLGATGIAPGQPNRAFAMVVTKGDPASTQIIHAENAGDFIQVAKTVEGSAFKGTERSTVIGPALEWHTVYWKQDPLENPNFDKTKLSIRALDANRSFQFQIDTTFTPNDSIINFNNLIDAAQYPYLQLQATYIDSIDQTPAQIDRWHVLYETLPEAAIDGTLQYTFKPNSPDSLREGQDISFAVDVKNISHLPMDSLLVNYWIVDRNQNIHPISYPRQDSLRVGETLRDTITFPTIGLVGNNVLWMEVNPFLNVSASLIKDQPELAHFNNVLQLPFHIAEDDINPILDVTFDGIHLLNGDIVNPRSEIVITLKDNNPYLVMDSDKDTSLFGIFLTPPSGVQKKIPFLDGSGNQIMQWIPADGDNLKFKIIFPAEFEEDGEYELLVQGADRSGNLSGDLEYRIKFDVILSSSITHMMNYPNPFSTKTRFVFTLTGMEVPDELLIQIMTVTGRVVREITQDELGPIRIGRNITEYAWDGRDEFGDQLANGVYLYRVTARINGESIEHRSSGADQHFKRNWGKMYLMR